MPAAPSRSDPPEDFIEKADAFVAWFDTFVTEFNAAYPGLDITLWVTGTTYAVGNRVISPADFRVYVRKTAGANFKIQHDFLPATGHKLLDITMDLAQKRHVFCFLIEPLRRKIITKFSL